jgi:hypothetical protein
MAETEGGVDALRSELDLFDFRLEVESLFLRDFPDLIEPEPPEPIDLFELVLRPVGTLGSENDATPSNSSSSSILGN